MIFAGFPRFLLVFTFFLFLLVLHGVKSLLNFFG